MYNGGFEHMIKLFFQGCDRFRRKSIRKNAISHASKQWVNTPKMGGAPNAPDDKTSHAVSPASSDQEVVQPARKYVGNVLSNETLVPMRTPVAPNLLVSLRLPIYVAGVLLKDHHVRDAICATV